MNHKNTILLCALLLLFWFPARSQDEKNFDAVYNSILKEYTLHPDGSIAFRYVKDQTLLTYRAINSMYGETFVVYNPRHQKLEINDCFTTMADGKKVKTPSNAFNEVLPGFAANAPDFNLLREMVITHTGLERKAVIRLDYTITSEKGFYPALGGNELLSETEPVKEMTIRIRVPLQQELVYKMFNLKSEPARTTEGNFRVYTWKLENVPVISAEENQAGGYELYPRLIFTTAKDAKATWSSFVSNEAFGMNLSADMKKVAENLAADTPDKTTLALKIQEKVVNEINLTAVPLKYNGFRPRTPARVWEGNYGTVPEKALLLAAMLNNAGIPARPAGVFRASQYDSKVADLYGMEEMIVRASVPEGEVLWLSVSSLNNQDLTRSMPGKVFLEFGDGGSITETRPEMPETQAYLTGNLYFNGKNEMNGELTAALTGPVNPAYALQRDNEKARQWISGGVGRQDIKEVKFSQAGPETSKFTFQVQKDNAMRKDTMLRTFILPYLSAGTEGWGIRLLPSYRNTPFEVPSAMNESVELFITVPEGYEVLSPENEVAFSNTAGSFRFELKKDAGKIAIKKELKLTSRRVDPKHYAAFKSLMDSYNVQQAKEITFIVK